MTWEGKLIVSLSILAGVAVIPAQAAAVVEALLERDADDNLRSDRIRTPAKPSSASSMPSNMVLETTETCPLCGAGLHWAQANFCYNCGEKLSNSL